MSVDEQAPTDANLGESESTPEALVNRQEDSTGSADNRRWRYAVREVDALEYAGPGIWRQIGPAPLVVGNQQLFLGVGPDSGEVVDIAFDPRPNGRLYIAAGSGGVWRSDDDGASWRPTTDQLPATSIGAIAVDPVNPDIVYAGTGNLFDGQAGMPKSAGLFRSVDAGASWSRLTSPAGRPPQPITAATNVAGGVRVTVAGHGYATFDRVAAIGLPGVVGAANEAIVVRIDDDTLRLNGMHLVGGAYAGGGTLFDARQPPFLSDRGIVRMVCPVGGQLLVASESGLYYSVDGGRNFGANHPAFDDGKPLRTGVISALEVDTGWTRQAPVLDATPASPIVVRVSRHGFASGDHVVLGGVTSNREANGGWVVDAVDDDHFSLRGSTGNGTGATTGFVQGPSHPTTVAVTGATNPAAPAPIVVTGAAHGFVTGDVVAVSGVQGTTRANGSWAVRVLGPDTFALVGSRGNAAYTGGGVVDGPRHPAPLAITAAVNAGGGVTATVVGHGLLDGDRVSVLGLPGIAAPGNSASVRRVDDDHVRLAGLTMNAAYGGAGATLAGPADSWNTVYFVAGGRQFGTTALNPDRGIFRLTIASTGQVVLSDNLLAHSGGVPGAFGRVALTQSMLPRTRTLYASVQDGERGHTSVFVGLFRSDDSGTTWQARPALAARVNVDNFGDQTQDQTSYDLTLGVDPQDSRLVYAAQKQLWRSIDSGGTWPTVTAATRGGVDQLGPIGAAPSTTLVHWDHHELVFPPPTRWTWTGVAPDAPTPAYVGTDGGIYRSSGPVGGALSFTALNEGIATSLLNSLAIGRGPGNNDVTFGGMQDCGTGGHRRGDAHGTWLVGIDGDGGPVAVDPVDPDIVYGTTNGRLIKSTDGGTTYFQQGIARTVPVEAVANTNPVRVTTAPHSYRAGDSVTIAGVTGGGGLANGASVINVVDKRTIELRTKNGTTVAAFGTGPTVTGDRFLAQADVVAATQTAPIEIQTTQPHGCATGQRVRIDAVQGNTTPNNTDARPAWTVTVIDAHRLSLDGSDGTLGSSYVQGTGRLRGPAVHQAMPVFGTVNRNPVVVTAQGHGFLTGDQVTVAGVLGNTNANVAAQPIHVLDNNSFELVGVAGNGNPGAVPRVAGPNVGGGGALSNQSYIQRIALEPNGANPSTTIYFAQDQTLFKSTNSGRSFVAMFTFADHITALHAPAANRLWVATSDLVHTNQHYRVFFSSTGGGTYLGTAAHFVRDVGARSFISQIIEDPAVPAGTRVAVVAAGYSRTATPRRTRHVFLTETGGISVGGNPAWHELGGTFNAPTGNLPDIPVMDAAWDTSTVPSSLLVASDAGVLRLDGATWKRVGPNLPKAGVQAIVRDSTAGQQVLRIATYGRSAWEFTVPADPTLHVEADLGFGDLQVGQSVTRDLVLHSVGGAPLNVTAIDGSSTDIVVTSRPPGAGFPLALASGEHRAFSVTFTPSVAGDRGSQLMVSSDDPTHPSILVKATGFGIIAGRPRLSTRAFLEFGTVHTGAPGDLVLEIRNLGDGPMSLDAIDLDAAGSNRFTLVNPPAVPRNVPAGGSESVTVRFDPIANGPAVRSLVVRASGQGQVVNLVGTGTTTAAGMVAVLFDLLGVGGPPDAVA
ncbi:choice-of-anchor D domain-containing protein [Cellulomonas sp. McL0617]|uniref:choice-of-anchor D domain-containing protein n=1 Tax=Cellulomonas sp. McL0617 TaxID=3415675 RepID=UPI003CF14979